jgi:hypothetical protein
VIKTPRLLLALGSLSALTPAAVAQVSGRIDVGVGGAPVNERGTVSLWSVAPMLRYQSPRLRLTAEGEYRDYGRLAQGASGFAEGSHFTRLGGALLAEATGTVRTRFGVGTADGVAWDLGGRLHLTGQRTGLWLGGQAGHDLQGRTLRWEAAAWRRFGELAVQLEGSQRSALNPVRPDVGFPDTLTPPDSLIRNQIRVTTDLGLWLRWAPRRLNVALGAGRRYGITEVAADVIPGDIISQKSKGNGTNTATWWIADATYWLSPRLGLNGSIGSSPPDPQFRTTGGRFLRLAFRAAFGREGMKLGNPASRDRGRLVVRQASGSVSLELKAEDLEGVRRVELMGDFTDWLPIEMQRIGPGHWRSQFAIAPGMHFVNVRYDGGPWQTPPGTRVVTDEFERLTGVVVVE